MFARILSVVAAPPRLSIMRLSRTPRGLVLEGFATQDVSEDAGPEQLAQAARDLAVRNGILHDAVCLGLDSSGAYLRHVHFPFSGKAKIAGVLGNELDAMLPQSAATLAATFAETALDPGPGRTVLAAAMERDTVQDMVQAFAGQGMEVTLAVPDIAGLDAVLAEVEEPSGSPWLALLPGADHVDVLCRMGRLPLYWRRIPAAPDQSGDVLARELRLAALNAARGNTPPAFTSVAVGIQGHDAPQELFQATQDALGVCQPHALPLPPFFREHPELRDQASAMLAAYGVARMGLGLAAPVDLLRPGAPLPTLTRRGRKEMLLAVGGAALIFLVSLLGGAGIQQARKSSTLDDLRQRTTAILAETIPDAPANLSVDQKLSILRRAVNDAAQNAAEPTAQPGALLPVLGALHRAVPAGMNIRVTRLAQDEAQIAIDATADDFNAVEELKRRISATRMFKGVDIRGVKSSPEKKGVEFRLEMTLAAAPAPAGGAQ